MGGRGKGASAVCLYWGGVGGRGVARRGCGKMCCTGGRWGRGLAQEVEQGLYAQT